MAKVKKKSTSVAKKVGRHERSLANLEKGRRGPRSKRVSSVKYDLFCIHYKISGNATKAAIYAGFAPTTGYHLLNNPRVIERLPRIDEEMLAAALKQVAIEFVLERSLLDAHLADRIVNGKTHFVRGDSDIVKAIEVGYKALGVIKATQVTNVAQANAAASANQIDIYKPQWLQDSEAKLLQDLNAKYVNMDRQLASKRLTIEEAKGYLERAGGDKNRAREMARVDGREI